MKTAIKLRICLIALAGCFLFSCSSQSKISGTASDRTGTNGATNGTGKIAKSL